MASLVGYLEKCLELARDGVPSVRLEGDAAATTRPTVSDDATPPSVAPSQADEAEIEQARAKLLDFLDKTLRRPEELLRRAERGVRSASHAATCLGELNTPGLLLRRATRSSLVAAAVASALGLSGDGHAPRVKPGVN